MITKRAKTRILATYSIAQNGKTYTLMRNERQLMTPAGTPFSVKQENLAKAIVEEWEAQEDKIIPATMPLTQLLATALDIIGKDKAKTQKALAAYIPTELLCYRADKPETLVKKQRDMWQPYLDWCEKTFSAPFAIGLGLMPIQQSQETIDNLTAKIESYDDMMLSALSSAVDCSGSLVLGLALLEGFRPAEDIFEACELDAKDQVLRWGNDPVIEKRHEHMLFELQSCQRWINLIKA